MLLCLKKKNDCTDRDALVIMLDWETDGKRHKYVRKIDIGETIDVSDDLGYAIMAGYRGCFVQTEPVKQAYETKTMRATTKE
jgi:hypothetical protein